MSQNIIPSDTVSPLEFINALSTLDHKAIIRVDNPPPGVAGFLFDVDLDQSTELMSEITDHYVENNSSLQDHIALKPEKITLNGMVGELRYTNPKLQPWDPKDNALPVNQHMQPVTTPGWISLQATTAFNSTIGAATSAAFNGNNIGQAASRSLRASGGNILATAKYNGSQAVQGSIRTLLQPDSIKALLTVGTPLPVNTQNAVNTIARLIPNAVKTIVDSVKNLVNPPSQTIFAKPAFFTTSSLVDQATLFDIYQSRQAVPPAAARQTSAFLYFYSLWRSRQIFSVETPWGIWTNMAIENCKISQDEDTRYASNFTITFKKIRVASDLGTELGPIEGRSVSPAPSERNGAQVKESKPVSFQAGFIEQSTAYMNALTAKVNAARLPTPAPTP